MKLIGLLLGALLFSRPLMAAADVSANDLSVWHVLLGIMPILIVTAFGFGIYKIVAAARSRQRPGSQFTAPIPPAAFPDGRTEKFCTDCGAAINVRAEICPKCGVRQPPLPVYGANGFHGRNKLAAALFALFLGGLGIHKFYLGRVGQGVLYLLFCWTFIPAIIGFIEGIVYLTMSEPAFTARYGAA